MPIKNKRKKPQINKQLLDWKKYNFVDDRNGSVYLFLNLEPIVEAFAGLRYVQHIVPHLGRPKPPVSNFGAHVGVVSVVHIFVLRPALLRSQELFLKTHRELLVKAHGTERFGTHTRQYHTSKVTDLQRKSKAEKL